MVSPSEIGTLLKVKIYLSWASLHQSVKAFNKEESISMYNYCVPQNCVDTFRSGSCPQITYKPQISRTGGR